jgi:hypothetical protein
VSILSEATWAAISWGVAFVAWLFSEVMGLRSKTDRWPTFTDLVRRIRGDYRSPMWWLIFGFLVWLIVHFLFI